MKSILPLVPLVASVICCGAGPRVGSVRVPVREEGPAGYRVRLQAEGLPWTRSPGAEQQILSISPGALRIVSEETGEGIIVLLDEKSLYTLSPPEGTFKKEPLGRLALDARRQEDREKKRKRILEKSKSDEDADRFLEQAGLRRDGRTIIEVKKTGETKVLAGHACDFYEVEENGIPVIRIWAAPDLDRSDGLTRFFGETRIFSDEMVSRVTSIPGLPLGLEVEMDYGLGRAGLSLTITSVEQVDLPASEFAIPEGLEPVAEPEPPPDLACPVCGARVKKDTPHFLVVRGKTYQYDSIECKEKDKKRIAEEMRGKK